MEIENKYSFEQALRNGINFFAGAGFSVRAMDADGRFLPTGQGLVKELDSIYQKGPQFSLAQISSILEATDKENFHKFLNKRFSVCQYDSIYDNLTKIRIRSIYTTNIDDLFFKIFEKSNSFFLRDQATLGTTQDPRAVHYLPLHGCVKNPERGYVFDVTTLANIYSDTPRIWNCLSHELEVRPTIFIGYGFGDSSVIQALTSRQTFVNVQKEKWVVLRKEDQQYAEYYKSQGFSIIKASLEEILDFFGTINVSQGGAKIGDERANLLKPYIVPNSVGELTVQRPIRDFFAGSDPLWCDIISNQLYRTQYFSRIIDSVNNPHKNTIIIGAPVSGKTTLMMQVASAIDFSGWKLFFPSLSEDRARFIVKILDKSKALICVDNIYDSIDVLPILERDNITLICAERSHNFGIISHLIDKEHYDVINVTTLCDMDLQGVFKALPQGIRNEYLKKESELRTYGKDSIFEFVIRNVNFQNIKERYKNAILKLENEDPELAEFLILCAYMHSCHIPVSIEMVYDYFDYGNYNDVFDLTNDAEGIIKEYLPLEGEKYEDMDYYYPRSKYIAEVIIGACSSKVLSKVLNTVIANIPQFRICDYRKFRKFGFDKNLAVKAFKKWEEGRNFYENAFLYDGRNPYILQQGALYLSSFGQYRLAFEWIDRAINMTNDKYFSIRNTHAIILFNANINNDSDDAKMELHNSMAILEKCISNDARKRFHANTYGQQAIRYAQKYKNDEQSVRYLQKAYQWLDRELKESSWDKEIAQTKDEVYRQMK